MNSWWTSSKSNTWSHPVCFFPDTYWTDWTRQDCQMTCSPSGPTDHSATSLLLLCYSTSLLQRLLPWDARVGTCIHYFYSLLATHHWINNIKYADIWMMMKRWVYVVGEWRVCGLCCKYVCVMWGKGAGVSWIEVGESWVGRTWRVWD